MSQLLCLLPIFALSGADDTEQFYGELGDKYKVIDGIVCATEQKYVDELRTAMYAKDEEGCKEMIAKRQARIIDEGTLLILKVHDRKLFGNKEYVECRHTQDGKNMGKVFVFSFMFTSKFLEPLEK
jgi:hypothetical protein